MKKCLLSCILILTAQITLANSTQAVLEQWSIKDVFAMPESAVFDPQRKWIYVSNVNQYAKDNNGYVSRVSLDGKK